MKILAPTDFSSSANNSVEYAASLADALKASLVLFNAIPVPVIAGEGSIVVPAMGDMESETVDELKKLREKLLAGHPSLDIGTKTTIGFAMDEIMNECADLKCELMVAGMKGKGRVGEYLIGSTSYSLARNSDIPVMVVPEGAKFNRKMKILLAADYMELNRFNGHDLLAKFCKVFHSELMILHVLKPGQIPGKDEAVNGLKLDHRFMDVPHSFHFIEGADATDGIDTFAAEHNINLLVTVSREHGLLEKLFHPNTPNRKFIFHSKIPVLALHG